MGNINQQIEAMWEKILENVRGLQTENARLREAFVAFIHAHTESFGIDREYLCNEEDMEDAISAVGEKTIRRTVLKETSNE